jgi:hypothetical protein
MKVGTTRLPLDRLPSAELELDRVPIDLNRRRAHHRVTRGLDPRVHPLRKERFAKRMDCRVKPGNDSELDQSDRNQV